MPRFIRNLALLATLGIALVVLFPAMTGPFTATYGPASAFRALAFAALVLFALSLLKALTLTVPQITRLWSFAIDSKSYQAAPLTIALRC